MRPHNAPEENHAEDTTAPPWLVDSKRAAELLGISPRSLFELQATGKLLSLLIGRRRLFDLTDLRAFVDAAKKGGAR